MTTPSPGPPCPSPTTQRSESVHFQGKNPPLGLNKKVLFEEQRLIRVKAIGFCSLHKKNNCIVVILMMDIVNDWINFEMRVQIKL